MHIPRLLLLLIILLTVFLGWNLVACYSGRGWLTWEVGSNMAEVLGAAGTLTSVLFIYGQVRQQTKLKRADNATSLVGASSPFAFMLLENTELTAMWREGKAKFDSYDMDQRAKYRHMLIWWLSLYDNIYYQHSCGLLDPQVFQAWEADLKFFIERRDLPRHWDDLKDLYGTSFRMYINGHIGEDLDRRRATRP